MVGVLERGCDETRGEIVEPLNAVKVGALSCDKVRAWCECALSHEENLMQSAMR